MTEKKLKIFVSYAEEDKKIARKLAQYLIQSGTEVWIDYARMQAGKILLKEMGKAIKWCDLLVLIWSKWAESSRYVELEWTSAVANKKQIIPCMIDNTPLPTIFSGILYLDFENFEQGYRKLARDLNLSIKKEMRPFVILRNQPAFLSFEEVEALLKKYKFYDDIRNDEGQGFDNKFKVRNYKRDDTQEKDRVVIDEATALMWQQSGSDSPMLYEAANNWVKKQNDKLYAGYRSWRLPTLEEAMSLVKKGDKDSKHFDPVFDNKQMHIWTSDSDKSQSWAWAVYFKSGHCDCNPEHNYSYVRAVRSLKIRRKK